MSYLNLLKQYREIAVLGTIRSQLWWDREVNLPSGAQELRDEQDKLLATLVQARFLGTEFRKNLEEAQTQSLSALEKRQVDLIRREAAFATSMSKEFLEKYVDSQNLCYAKFKEAKETQSFHPVASSFEKMVDLYIESAELLKDHKDLKAEYQDKGLYDIMIDSKFDPGLTNSDLARFFSPIKDFLISKRAALQEGRPATEAIAWPKDLQSKVSRELCEKIGFDFTRGRIDETTIHPFCGGSTGDVRLTTKIDPQDSAESLMATMHEVGHGLYEQGLPREYSLQPLGIAPSAAIHESQSRFVENQIGRSPAFIKYLSKMTGESYEKMYRAIAGKKESFLRVEADEVDYNLHVILRWEMEQEIVSKRLKVRDIPDYWNSLFKKYFGRDVPSDRMGCVQDIHWYGIGFGYFPSYAIGNLIAGQLMAKFEKENQNWAVEIENGNLAIVKNWLNQKVHRWGSQKDTPGTLDLIFEGEKLNPQYFIDYLEARYSSKRW